MKTQTSEAVRLSELTKGESGRIHGCEVNGKSIRRLMELGFVENAMVSLQHEAPISRDPVVVAINGTRIALRRSEASEIWIVRTK